MLLDLRPREIALPGGVTVVARPLESWAYLRWLEHGLRFLAGAPEIPDSERVRRAAADAEAHRLAGEILSAHALRVEGLEIQEPGGRRPGTVQDLVTQGALAGHVLRAMNALLAGSVLSEADVGNSAAPPQPGAPGHVTP
jgi:hypothetical protein